MIASSVLVAVVLIGIFVVSGKDNSDSSDSKADVSSSVSNTSDDGFTGDKGDQVEASGSNILITKSEVDDGDLHAFNYYSEDKEKNIYFFVIKADDGTYRVAANGCEVCFGSKKGFVQQGDKIKCTNCGQSYSKNQIAKHKGGCNPRPIDADASVEDGNLVINVSDVEGSADLF